LPSRPEERAPPAENPNEPFRALDVPGFLPAVLYEPSTSARRAVPLVVASHGAGGVPEAECSYWREVTRGRAILLCLRGARIDVRWDSGYYYPTHHELERELQAALDALTALPRINIDWASSQYVGFSQGATMGAVMIVNHAERFPHLVLIEGGVQYWSVAHARAFARHGGKRVLFVCGTRSCDKDAKKALEWLRMAKVDARVEYAQGAGHTPAGAVFERLIEAFPWVTAGEDAWKD
jgi:predicted esterase